MHERARRVAWRWNRAQADTSRRLRRRGSARPVTDLLGGVARRNGPEWMSATSDAHPRMRSGIDPAPGSVAIVCVSMRPEHVAAFVEHASAQRGPLERHLEVLFVANSHDFDVQMIHSEFRRREGWRLIDAPDAMPLGAALNLAMAQTDARFVAKFDDDDLYGPDYLSDALRAHAYAGAGVVGKHTYYAELVGSGRDVLRFPGHEYRYSSALAGGTLVIDRETTGDLAFDEISLGEDQAFIRACHRIGVSTFSADRFNFVQVRHGNNTWSVPDDEFAADSVDVDDSAEHRVMR